MKSLTMWNVSKHNEKAVRRMHLLSGGSIYSVVDSLLSEMLKIRLAKEVREMKFKHEKRFIAFVLQREKN